MDIFVSNSTLRQNFKIEKTFYDLSRSIQLVTLQRSYWLIKVKLYKQLAKWPIYEFGKWKIFRFLSETLLAIIRSHLVVHTR